MVTNTTNGELLSWVQEPDGRGTFGILKSCVITLVLCVYTALHLNIPPANSSKSFLLWRKAKWILVGLFAPEVVVYIAWDQRQRVKRLSGDVSSICAEEAKKDRGSKRKHEWTMTHSWFAYMGGFAIDTKQGQDELPAEYIPGSPRLALNRKAVTVLARSGMLPDISKESITDKSKADALAKALVITQASWLILQCIMRFANGLHVTALELNTLAHAVCALLIYALWWHKPLDITEPALLAGGWAPGLAATLWACSRGEIANVRWIEKDLALALRAFCDEPDSAEQLAQSLAGDPEQEYSITIIETETRRKTTYNLMVHDPPHPITFTVHGNGEKNPILLLMAPGANALLCPPRPSMAHGNTGTYNAITLSHLVRWQLLRRLVHDQPLLAALLFREAGVSIRDIRDSSLCYEICTAPMEVAKFIQASFPDKILRMTYLRSISLDRLGYEPVTTGISNWVEAGPDTAERAASTFQSMAVFWLAALIYGALHAIAWKDHFATPAEALMWKISCIYVAGYGSVVIAILAPWEALRRYEMYQYPRLDENWHHRPEGKLERNGQDFWSEKLSNRTKNRLKWFGSVVFIVTPVLFYFFCRVFLVAEGFVGLRSLPALAFHTPEWTQYLAHL
ncbi:hypothetical protein B0T14DRAFT_498097 [Immersiella caudata]|uniref:Uncharacterized protein n=1 Tax=Immersiella caudata TaxID=314043 RepID=A0AA40BX99_9PEZI|nr:hypothetical protein B0T14DRAFT_498097 [Immersiella caudata]